MIYDMQTVGSVVLAVYDMNASPAIIDGFAPEEETVPADSRVIHSITGSATGVC